MFDSLDAVWSHAWARLLAGARGRDDPFHQGVLANAAADGPQARYAVLRAVDPDAATVGFHTDRRSPKLPQLQADPRVSWCFFGHGEQVRLRGRVVLHLDDATADAAWAACGRASRATYTVPLAPGTAIEDPGLTRATVRGQAALHGPLDPPRVGRGVEARLRPRRVSGRPR